MTRPKPAPSRQPASAIVLTKALLRAAQLLELSSAVLARILGVSEASISRLASGARTIDPASKEGELALLLVRVYRSLTIARLTAVPRRSSSAPTVWSALLPISTRCARPPDAVVEARLVFHGRPEQNG